MDQLKVGHRYRSILIDAPSDLIKLENVTVLDSITRSDGNVEFVIGIQAAAVDGSWILEAEELEGGADW